jgi:hypothetical protein
MDGATNTATAGEPTPAKSDRCDNLAISFYLVCFALAIALYVLSPGPIAKYLAAPQHRLPRTIEIAFVPLQFSYDHSSQVRRFYDWYLKDLWHVP